MRIYADIGIQTGEILLPAARVDLARWAVIACDQFTSQPEYWQRASEIVGDAPSTLNLILPEVLLGTAQEAERIQSSQAAMQAYQDQGILQAHDGMILVERTVMGKTRRGLMLALDLEQYDFSKGSQSLIRATEGTIVDRLPPRVRIRQGASLELPHILVLIDDPQRTVIEPIAAQTAGQMPLYQTELMQGSGSLTGYAVDEKQEAQIVAALRALAQPQTFRQKYDVGEEAGVLLFAMGDGNHSLATAKTIWEQIKAQVGPDHPARYALVEVENLHDAGLEFEPIHRVLFGVREELGQALKKHFGERAQLQALSSAEGLRAAIERATSADAHAVGVVTPEGAALLTIRQPTSNLPVGSLQGFLDAWGAQGGFEQIDYVHGEEVVRDLGSRAGHIGFLLPTMPKRDLFRTVILDGVLPRKTFSMGEAPEKRFYMECRRIMP